MSLKLVFTFTTVVDNFVFEQSGRERAASKIKKKKTKLMGLGKLHTKAKFDKRKMA